MKVKAFQLLSRNHLLTLIINMSIRDRSNCPASLLTLTRVTRLFLFLLYEQVAQALIHSFGVLPIRLEPWDTTACAPYMFANRCIGVHCSAGQPRRSLLSAIIEIYFIVELQSKVVNMDKSYLLKSKLAIPQFIILIKK